MNESKTKRKNQVSTRNFCFSFVLIAQGWRPIYENGLERAFIVSGAAIIFHVRVKAKRNHREIIAEIFIQNFYHRSSIKLFTLKIPREQNLYRVFTSSYSLHPSLLAFVQKYHVLLLSVALTGFLGTKKATMLLLLFL